MKPAIAVIRVPFRRTAIESLPSILNAQVTSDGLTGLEEVRHYEKLAAFLFGKSLEVQTFAMLGQTKNLCLMVCDPSNVAGTPFGTRTLLPMR
ncbi:hypothetical protein [Paraburkholderia youngii]|uniref:hypothetical protein n=1 Tax=Paraburkholderia youngii TaxID=2782701 RepID=UPI003D220F63